MTTSPRTMTNTRTMEVIAVHNVVVVAVEAEAVDMAMEESERKSHSFTDTTSSFSNRPTGMYSYNNSMRHAC